MKIRQKAFRMAGLGAGTATAAFPLARRYRREMDAAYARLAEVNRREIPTRWGAVEYAEEGAGEPLLVIHGIFHGCDGGLFSVRNVCPNRRLIAPSRFGYLGSSLPRDATPADQADAYAALLDALEIEAIDVIGVSAGATSSLQFALRHADRVKHLALLVGNLPGARTAAAQPSWALLLDRQGPIWLIKTLVPSLMTRLLGVPKGFALTSEDARYIDRFIDSMFPIAPRLPGIIFDVRVSNPDVTGYDLEAITVPTLIVHTKDDSLASHEASRRATERIRGARFVSLESGGHLMLGQDEIARSELTAFFTRPTTNEPAAATAGGAR